jgi:hypothetical protein
MVLQAGEPAVLCRADLDVLNRLRTIAVRGVHLRPGQHELYRAADLPRRHRSQRDVRPGDAFAAKAATEKRADTRICSGLMPNSTDNECCE